MTWRTINTAPEGGEVLIITALGRMHVAWRHNGWNVWWREEPLDEAWEHERPTHWHPLPEKPDDLKAAISALDETISSIGSDGRNV